MNIMNNSEFLTSDLLKRANNIPVITRKAVPSVIRTANTLFGESQEILTKICDCCGETKTLICFYVKKHKQHIRSEELTQDDHRNICIPCHDAERKKNREAVRLNKQQFIDNYRSKINGMTDNEILTLIRIADEILADRAMPEINLENIFESDNG